MDCEQLRNLIKKRRSIRRYIPDPVPDVDINNIIEAGLYAPSGKNRRPWRFAVLKDVETIRTIAKATTFSKFARYAPIMVLVFAKTDPEYPLEKDMISIGACLQNMMLTATAMGYGSCIIGELYGHVDTIRWNDVSDPTMLWLVAGLIIGKSEQLFYNAAALDPRDYIINISENTQNVRSKCKT